MKSSSPTHQEISQHAYQIYVRNGCKHGHETEHWLQAEAELRQMMSEPVAQASPAANGSAKTAPTVSPQTAVAAAPPATAASTVTKSKPAAKKTPKSAK